MEKQRIAWIDIYKGLAIILVVLGHSTGKFNGYIYQFHMAAFFCISGYTALKSIEEESFQEFFIKKITTLMIPCFIMVILFGLFYVFLDKINILAIWDSNNFVGIKLLLKEFVYNGNINISCLGASWFIIVLFGIFILNKVIYTMTKKKNIFIYILINVALYCLAYFMMLKEINIHIAYFDITLVFIGQFFFMIGLITHKYGVLDVLADKKISIVVLGLTLLTIYKFGTVAGVTVDYPSHFFPNFVLNTIAGINGALCLAAISRLFEKLKPVEIIFSNIGKNSLGILFLHFSGMKIAYIVLYGLKVVPIEFIGNLVPTTEIGNQYWWLILITGLMFSMIIWKLLKNIPILNMACGQLKIDSKVLITFVSKNMLVLISLLTFIISVIS